MDYIIEVNSELDYIYRAFSMVAHLFSKDSDYMGLLAIFSAAAIFFTAIFATVKTGLGKADIKMWIMYIAGTWAVMLLITGKKVEVTIHDLTLNEVKSIGGVPEVMAFIGTLENKIERTIVEMIETVMTPLIPYDAIGKGDGFQLLANTNTMATNYLNDNIHVKKSISSYYNKCVIPDLSLGFESPDIIHNSPDIWTSIKSETRSRTTIVYTADDAQGRAYPCAEAYDEISKELSIAAITKVITDECEMSTGIKNDSCSQNLNHIVKGGIAPNSDVNKYLRSYIVSYIIMSNEGMIESALADVNKKNMSQGILAESQLPRLKSVVFGLMIGIFPLLVLFLFFNPVKAITFYLGLFMMMILWGSLDAFMDMQYQNEVMNMFAVMRRPGNELGVHQMFDISSKAADAVSLYGSSRWLMLGLATAISSAITGINSYAMSQFGSQLGSTAQQAAGSRADSLGTAGDMRLKEQGGEELALRMRADEFTVANQGNGIAARAYQSAETGIATAGGIRDHHGSNQAAVSATAGMNVASHLSGLGSLEARTAQANALGLADVGALSAFRERGSLLTDDMASGLNNKYGTDSFNTGQKVSFDMVGDELRNMKLSSANGADINHALNDDGQVISTTKNGLDGKTQYSNFTEYANGMATGSKTFNDGGVAHTQSFNGSRMTDVYSSGGQEVTQSHALAGGDWIETSRQIGNSISLSNQVIEMAKEGDYRQLVPLMTGEDGKFTPQGRAIATSLMNSITHINESQSSSTGIGGSISGNIGAGKGPVSGNIGANGSTSAQSTTSINVNQGLIKDTMDMLDDPNMPHSKYLSGNQKGEIILGAIHRINEKGESLSREDIADSLGREVGDAIDGVKNKFF